MNVESVTFFAPGLVHYLSKERFEMRAFDVDAMVDVGTYLEAIDRVAAGPRFSASDGRRPTGACELRVLGIEGVDLCLPGGRVVSLAMVKWPRSLRTTSTVGAAARPLSYCTPCQMDRNGCECR